MKHKTSIAAFCLFALLLQSASAYASSWNPGLLVNTETFQIIDDTDTASDLYVRFGDALNKRLTFERTLDRFNFNDDVYVSGDFTVKGTASGKTIFATESLRSSGSLVWEGSASGASLWVSTFQGAGLTSCNADGETLAWNATSKQFECGDDDTGGGSSYYAGQGLSLASSFFSLNASFTGTSLEIMGTASGRNLHAQDRLTTSGSMIISGAAPTLTSTYDTSGSSYDVAIAGRYAYIADESGIRIIDISKPTAPAQVGTYTTTGSAYGIAIAGRYAYVAVYASGLDIIDISNPASPVFVGTYDTSNNAYRVAVAGRYAYVADYGGGLKIIDIGNPTSPKLIGTYTSSDIAYGLAVAGRYVYLADGGNGLRIIDVSNPASPSVVGTYNTSGQAFAVSVSGRYAYVADYSAGVRVIDISNASSPTLVGTYDTSGAAYDIDIAGRYAYVADDTSGLQVIDILNPASPTLASTYDTAGNSKGIAISGLYVYVADEGQGLQIIKIQGIDAPAASIGTVDTNMLNVRQDARINGNFSVDRGMNIGDGLYVFGQTALRAFSGAALTLATQDRGGAPALNVAGTASGKTIFATESLRSSGSLVWEGGASGASLWVSTFQGAGLTSCNADGETLAWNSTTKKFECGDDDTGAGGSTAAAQGLTAPASGFLSLSTSFSGTNLEIMGTASGRVIHAQNQLESSGSLTVDGAAYLESTLKVAGTVSLADGSNARLTFTDDTDTGIGHFNANELRLSAGGAIWQYTDSVFNTQVTRGPSVQKQGETATPTYAFVGDTDTGMLGAQTANTIDFVTNAAKTARIDTSGLSVVGISSGKIIYAAESLRSSGTLVWEGAASGASLWVSKFKGAGLISTCDATTGKLTWDSTAQQFTCGTDLNTGTSYAAAQGLSLASSFFRLNASFSGTSLEIMGTSSGRILHGNDKIQGSGTLITDGSISTKTNLTINSDNGAVDAVLTFGNDTLAETLTFSRANSRFEFSDDVYVQNAFEVDGNAQFDGSTLTFGDASGDAVTANSATWTFANDTAVGLTGGLNGINFDSNTLSIDGANDRIGIKTAAPDTELEVVGTVSGSKIFAQRSLATSGTLVVESSYKEGSGAITVTGQEYQTGAYLYASGAAVLALDSYGWTQTGARLSPHIMFGYRGVFDVSMYRHGTGSTTIQSQTKTGTLLTLDSETTTATNNIFKITSDVNTGLGLSDENLVFRVQANGATFADGAYSGAGADLAEWFPTADPGMTPGDLVCLDPKRPLHVKRCNSTKLRIIGIVSTKPGFIGGEEEKLILEGRTPVLVGLLGQIPTKVTGTVEIGDIIGLSRIDGVGSRLEAPGQSVCTALEPHEGEGISVITCLAPTLQFWTGSIGTE